MKNSREWSEPMQIQMMRHDRCVRGGRSLFLLLALAVNGCEERDLVPHAPLSGVTPTARAQPDSGLGSGSDPSGATVYMGPRKADSAHDDLYRVTARGIESGSCDDRDGLCLEGDFESLGCGTHWPTTTRFATALWDNDAQAVCCGVRTDDQQLECFGGGPGEDPPDDEFTAVDVGVFGCGLRPGGEISCWNTHDLEGLEWVPLPPGQYRSVAIHMQFGCAIDMDDQLHCFGYRESPAPTLGLADDNGARHLLRALEPPSGAFQIVRVGPAHACAIDMDDRLQCWGMGMEAPLEPSQPLSDPQCDHLSGTHACGQAKVAFDGVVLDVAVGSWSYTNTDQPGFTCALSAARTLQCWGNAFHSLADVLPDAQIAAVFGMGNGLIVLGASGEHEHRQLLKW